MINSFLFECLLSILHPNILLKNYTWTTNQQFNLIKVTYFSNDWLVFIQLTRIYCVPFLIAINSLYYSSSADRICKMLSIKLNYSFAFKCIIKKHPFKLLISLVVLSCTTFGLALQIIEGPVYKIMIEKNPNDVNSYENLADCIWNVFIIITTVGYGDYFPRSVLGRCLVFIISLVGIILVSLVIMTLQNAVSFMKLQSKAKDLVDRIITKNKLEEEASNYFKKSLSFLIKKNKFMKNSCFSDEEAYKKDFKKGIIDRVKQKNIFQGCLREFNRDFDKFDCDYFINEKIKDVIKKISLIKEDNIKIREFIKNKEEV